MESSQLPFPTLLKYHRERLNLSQTDLCNLLDVDHSYVSRLESGQRQPSMKLMRKLAPHLQMTRAETEQIFSAAGYMRPGAQAVESPVLQEIDILLHDQRLHPVMKVTIEGLLRSIVAGLEIATGRKGSDDDDQVV